jgi:RND family efflux transporter MFP subunit
MALAGCASDPSPPPPEDKGFSIRVATVASEQVTPMVRGVGTAVWRRETPLGFTSAGQIARVLVNEGDRVRRGQLLAILDTTSVGAELSAAEAEANRANNDVTRMAALFRKGWVTKARLEAAQAGAQTAGAQVQAKRFAVSTAKIVAPSNGIVLARSAEPTQVVAAGTPVITIGEAASGYVLRVPMNDREAAGVALGAPATIQFDALGAQALQGRVVEIGGKARQTTGTFDVEIAFEADARIRSGMFGSVAIMTSNASATARLMVPATAIVGPRGGQALVYTVDAGNRARLRTVSIGETTDAGIEILSGLSAGEQVAITGFDKLKEGVRILPVIGTR